MSVAIVASLTKSTKAAAAEEETTTRLDMDMDKVGLFVAFGLLLLTVMVSEFESRVALGEEFQRGERNKELEKFQQLFSVKPLFVVSGNCSLVFYTPIMGVQAACGKMAAIHGCSMFLASNVASVL